MKAIGRNDPCPCGSGRKFKKCHLGREDELHLGQVDDLSVEEMGSRITSLHRVQYGRSMEMANSLDIKGLTGKDVGIQFVDLHEYSALDFSGGTHQSGPGGKAGGIFINPYKTGKADPLNVYLAISEDIDESTLIHEMAHVLNYLDDSGHVPGTLDALGFEMAIPVDHLEHPEEFGRWLDYLMRQFDVRLDADDTIILYLYQHGLLVKGSEIRERNGLVLKGKSDRIFRFLSEHSEEMDDLLRGLPGYIGPRVPKD